MKLFERINAGSIIVSVILVQMYYLDIGFCLLSDSFFFSLTCKIALYFYQNK